MKKFEEVMKVSEIEILALMKQKLNDPNVECTFIDVRDKESFEKDYRKCHTS